MSNKCPTCGKAVYMAEEVKADGKSWHKGGCFQCQVCKTQLEKGKEMSGKGDGRTMCKACYAKNFGPKGYGYGGAMTGEYDKKS